LLNPPQLKDRLKMIERQRVSSLRRRLGYPALIAAVAVCAFSAASQASDLGIVRRQF
jgi:hypothetical protein